MAATNPKNLLRDNNGRFIEGNIGFWFGKKRDKITIEKIINTSRLRGNYDKPNKGQFKKGCRINLGRKLSEKEKLNISIKTRKSMTPEVKKRMIKKIMELVQKGTHPIFKNCAKKGDRRSIKTEFKKGNNPYIPLKNSSIEIKIQNFLKLLNIEFFTHYYLNELHNKYQCDIFIPLQKKVNQKTVIECDGDYWHGNPIKFPILNERQKKQQEKDIKRTKELIEKGFKIIRLWECDIREMSLNQFKKELGGVRKSWEIQIQNQK